MKEGLKKRLILGDMHGLIDVYQKIYKKENPDDVICLGDYVDSFDVDVKYQEYNMKCLEEMKNNHNKGEFIILLGNHDFHYLYGYPQYERYSGFSYTTFQWAHKYFTELVDNKTIQLIYKDDVNKTLYSHAGITNTWLNDWTIHIDELNDILFRNRFNEVQILCFSHEQPYNSYGDNVHQSCIWVRENSLMSDMYKDKNGLIWRQIVGHTPGYNIRTLNDNLIICDALGKKSSEYLIQLYDDETKEIVYENIVKL